VGNGTTNLWSYTDETRDGAVAGTDIVLRPENHDLRRSLLLTNI
jgi:hypothetical protein